MFLIVNFDTRETEVVDELSKDLIDSSSSNHINIFIYHKDHGFIELEFSSRIL